MNILRKISNIYNLLGYLEYYLLLTIYKNINETPIVIK